MSQDNQEMLKCPMCVDEPGSFPAARWSYEMNGENHDVFDDEKALAFLLANDTCFISGQCHGSRVRTVLAQILDLQSSSRTATGVEAMAGNRRVFCVRR